MSDSDLPENVFSTAGDDLGAAKLTADTPQTFSPSYRLAYNDQDFMLRDELRAVRLQLELLKPELLQRENGIRSTVVVFGSTRIPEAATAAERLRLAEGRVLENPTDPVLVRKAGAAKRILAKAHYYDQARELGRIITVNAQRGEQCELVVITGGGGGIMEAANRGASDAGGKSIGLNIVLPREQCPNAYITPEFSFQFHYFAIRKMHFLMRARALAAFPGGFGTLDEVFETLTLIQTRKIKAVPVLLFGEEYWRRIVDFEALVDEGTIDPEDLDLFQYVETATEAWEVIQRFHTQDVAPE